MAKDDQAGVDTTNSVGRQLRMTTSDMVTVEFAADPSVTILEAATQAGYTLPALCRKGNCGVCRAHLVSGDVSWSPYSTAAMSDSAVAAGEILLCATSPASDLQIDMPYQRSRIVDGIVPDRSGVIIALEECALNTVRLVVALTPEETVGAGLQFDAGQFANLCRPGSDVERAYSFANVGNWDGIAEFYIKLREGGMFSQYLRLDAAVGDELLLRGPSGAFGLHENGLRPRWFVCGGTGMAPILSMVRRMAEWQDPQPVRVLLGVDLDNEIFGLELLRELALVGGLETEVIVRRPGLGWQGRVGTSVDLLREHLGLVDERPDLYLCGSPGFLNAARQCAETAAVPKGQVYAELISPN